MAGRDRRRFDGAREPAQHIGHHRITCGATIIAAGGDLKPTHFHNLQHYNVFVASPDGVPESVLCG
jgi:hypothetical protein